MAAKSEEAVAVALSIVLRDHGWAVASSARRLRGGLSDVLGADTDEHRGVLDALVLAVEEGIVDELHDAGRDGVGTVLPDLVARLSEWGLTGERATWAVLTWAEMLPEATLPPPDLTAEPPGTRPEALAPTTLPPLVTAPAPTPEGPSGVTLAPVSQPRHDGDGTGDTHGRSSRRAAALVAVALVVLLAGGGVAAAMNWGGRPRPSFGIGVRFDGCDHVLGRPAPAGGSRHGRRGRKPQRARSRPGRRHGRRGRGSADLATR